MTASNASASADFPAPPPADERAAAPITPTDAPAAHEPIADAIAAAIAANDPEEAAKLAELAQLQVSSYKSLGPVLAITANACELLWQLAPKQPIVVELHRRTGLNKRTLAAMLAIKTPEEFANLWTGRLADYYYTLLVGRLILESPLRVLLRVMLGATSAESAQIDHLFSTVASLVRDLSPMTERWLIGQFDALPTDPLPTDPDACRQLAGWATRRAELEAYFASAAPALTHLAQMLLQQFRPAPLPPAPRGPFLRRTFTDAELAALRLLLTYVPTLTTLLPGQSFAKAMHGLSALQPPERVADLLQRLRTIKPGQPLHFPLSDCLTLFQILQSGALLLLRAASGDLVRTLRRHADDPHDPDEDLRIERGRLLFLLGDSTTRTEFRAVFSPLLKHFTAAVDRLFPHHAELIKARVELAELAAVR